MRILWLMVVPVLAAFLAAAPCFATGTGTAKPPEFVQATRVEGKVSVNLGGSWFLYAQAQFAGDKSRALPPEILAVSQRGDGDVALRLLDVQMPKSIDEPYKAASKKPKAWEPTPDDIAFLRKQWSKLPPAMNKASAPRLREPADVVARHAPRRWPQTSASVPR